MKTNFNLKMISKSIMAVVVLALLTTMMYSCGSSTSKNDNEKTGADSLSVNKTGNDTSSITVTTEDLKSTESTAELTTSAAVAKAKADGNSVFLIVTDPVKTDVLKALKIAKEANLSVAKSVILTMDRNNASNAALVAKYGVGTAPLPVILVISPKGLVAGGFLLSEATADLLTGSIPSPKQDEVLAAIDIKKSVLIVAAKSSFTDKATAVANCKSAVALNGNKSVFVEVDLADVKEATFLELMKINTATATTATVVVNNTGQVNGTFYAAKDAASLVTLANTVAKSGGCSPGSSCAPGACGTPK